MADSYIPVGHVMQFNIPEYVTDAMFVIGQRGFIFTATLDHMFKSALVTYIKNTLDTFIQDRFQWSNPHRIDHRPYDFVTFAKEFSFYNQIVDMKAIKAIQDAVYTVEENMQNDIATFVGGSDMWQVWLRDDSISTESTIAYRLEGDFRILEWEQGRGRECN